MAAYTSSEESDFENPDDDHVLDKVTVSSCSEEEASYEKTPRSTRKCKASVQKGKKSKSSCNKKRKKRKMLTKSAIKQITKSISDMPRDSLMQCVEMNLKKHKM